MYCTLNRCETHGCAAFAIFVERVHTILSFVGVGLDPEATISCTFGCFDATSVEGKAPRVMVLKMEWVPLSWTGIRMHALSKSVMSNAKREKKLPCLGNFSSKLAAFSLCCSTTVLLYFCTVESVYYDAHYVCS